MSVDLQETLQDVVCDASVVIEFQGYGNIYLVEALDDVSILSQTGSSGDLSQTTDSVSISARCMVGMDVESSVEVTLDSASISAYVYTGISASLSNSLSDVSIFANGMSDVSGVAILSVSNSMIYATATVSGRFSNYILQYIRPV